MAHGGSPSPTILWHLGEEVVEEVAKEVVEDTVLQVVEEVAREITQDQDTGMEVTVSRVRLPPLSRGDHGKVQEQEQEQEKEQEKEQEHA